MTLVILLVIPDTSGKCECSKCVYLCRNLDSYTKQIPFVDIKHCCNNMTNISKLNVSRSHITVLPGKLFSRLPFTRYVTELFLAGNNISEIRNGVFKNFTMMVKLDLAHNQLKEHQIVNTVCLRAPLQHLHLDWNPIGNISSATFNCTSSNTTTAMSIDTLVELTMTDCDIQNIANNSFGEFTKVNSFTLNLNRNKLSSLNFLEQLSAKEIYLYLAHNQLEDTSIFNNPGSASFVESVVLLSLDGNPILPPDRGLFLARLRRLRRLWLQNMPNLDKFPKMNLPKLSELQISYNNFTSPALDIFNNTRKLRYLNMTGINLGKLSVTDLERMFFPLQRLEKLILKSTELRGSVGSTFFFMKYMKNLELGDNHISNISGAFQTFTNIRTLLLNNNSISLVSPSDLPRTISSKLDLSGNPFECTCALAPFRTEYIPQHKKAINIYRTKSYVCHGPTAFKGKQLREFNPKYTECHGFNPYVITAIAVCVILILVVIVASVVDACKHRIKRYLQARKLTRQYTKISNSVVSDYSSPSTL